MRPFPASYWTMQGWWPTLFHFAAYVVLAGFLFWILRKKRTPSIFDGAKIATVTILAVVLLSSPQGYVWEDPKAASGIHFLAIFLLSAWGTVRNWQFLNKRPIPFAVFKSGSLLLLSGFCSTIVGFAWLEIPDAREAARRTQCYGNLKPIALMLHNYYDIEGSLPMATVGEPPYSWRVAGLPFIDQVALHEQYDFTSSWNQGSNQKIARTRIMAYQCPTRVAFDDDSDYPRTDYVAITGETTMWLRDRPITFPEIQDGMSNTIMVAEAAGAKIPWCKPEDIELSDRTLGIDVARSREKNSSSIMSSYHRESIHVTMADGSLKKISKEIDLQVLRALLTRDASDNDKAF